MKSTERHKLKENEFATSVAHAERSPCSAGRATSRRSSLVVLVLLVASSAATAGGAALARTRRTERWPRRSRSTRCRSCPVAAARTGQPAAGAAAGHLPDRAAEARRVAAEVPRGGRTPTRMPRPGSRRGSTRRRFWRRRASTPRRSSATRKWSTRREPRSTRAPRGSGWPKSQVAQGKFDNAIAVYSELSRDTTLDAAARQRADASRPRLRPGGEEGGSGAILHARRRRVPAVGLCRRCAPRDGRGEEAVVGDPAAYAESVSGAATPAAAVSVRPGAAARTRSACRCAGLQSPDPEHRREHVRAAQRRRQVGRAHAPTCRPGSTRSGRAESAGPLQALHAHPDSLTSRVTTDAIRVVPSASFQTI